MSWWLIFFALSASGAPLNVAAYNPRGLGPGWQTVEKLDGVRVIDAEMLLSGSGGVLIFNPSRLPPARDLEPLQHRLAEFLQRGGSVIFGLSAGSPFWDRQSENSDEAGRGRAERRAEFWDAQLGTLMPVNPWSAQNDHLKRLSTGATAPAGSRLFSALQTPGFRMDWRFDLHLPYSTIEAGQHRYEPAHFGKSLWNTDWQALLFSDQDGRLPLLVSGRYGAGKTFVFAGDLLGGSLAAWPGYGEFMRTLLLSLAAPDEADADGAGEIDALKLSLPMAQCGGPLALSVTNASRQPVRATLAVKIRNFTGSVRNAYTQPLTLGAGATQKILLVATAPALNGSVAPRAADAASANLLRVEAGVASADRRQTGATISGIVDLTPALTLSLEGENAYAFPRVEGWEVGGGWFSGGAVPAERYMYFCGETPKLKIRLANARHNIAPLAAATDCGWPENPTIEGLNDTANNSESVRGKQPVVYGYWVGRRNDRHAQQIRYEWPLPVSAVAQRLAAQGVYRDRNANNPKNYTLAGNRGAVPLLSVSAAEYTHCLHDDEFDAPAVITDATLTITGLDPRAINEPKPMDMQMHGVLNEWEIYGWPDQQLPPTAGGTLRVSVSDPATGAVTQLLEQPVSVSALREEVIEVPVPTRQRAATLLVSAEFIPAAAAAVQPVPNVSNVPKVPDHPAADPQPKKWLGREVKKTAAPAAADAQPDLSNSATAAAGQLSASYPLWFTPRGRDHLVTRDLLGEVQTGYLCSPGFVALEQFGTGARDDTQGWGGPDDKVWAWVHGMMEIWYRSHDEGRYFYLSPVRLTHYTNPWRDFPDGRYVWDWATDQLLDRFANRDWQGKTSLHVVGSDRWNGIPINVSFNWANYIRFDQHLRATGRPGLQGRTRDAINKEISEKYADEFQRYELERYADEMLKSQRRFADAGIRFTFEPHGSFPLAGGEVGAKLGRTQKAVGTDLFWELRDEDLYKSLGYRHGVIAANPDLESGAYNQWGWVSSVLANTTWFSTSGDVEPARRQWYSTYWAGRVTTGGVFKPYTVYGFSAQGSNGTKMTLDDWRQFDRVQSRMIWQRPERAAGVGLVASWQLQENRMTPAVGHFGFGLFAGQGHEQVCDLVGELYFRLVKNSVPVSFLASTHTLKNWQGAQPLVVTDGFDVDPWEIAELERLNHSGAPVIAVGSEGLTNRPEAEKFFGARYTGAEWQPAAGIKVVSDSGGRPLAFINGSRLFCPVPIRDLDGQRSAQLAALIFNLCGDPLTVSPGGYSAMTFVNDGSLYLTLGSQRDVAETVTVSVKPRLLDLSLTATQYRVIDLDRALALTVDTQGDTLTFSLPVAPNDGRMIQILPK